MSDLNKKIMLELLVTPATMMLGIGGLSLLVLSQIVGPYASFVGFFSIILAMGIIVKNFVFDLDSVGKCVAESLKEKEDKQEEMSLDDLDAKLVTDRDPRDQTALRNLRALYEDFVKDRVDGKINNVSDAMMKQVDDIFDGVVDQLKQQFTLYETSVKLTGNAKKSLLQQREDMIQEIETAIENLARTISDMRAMKIKTKKGELSKLQDRLTAQLSAAKAVDEFTASLDGDLTRFDEYAKK